MSGIAEILQQSRLHRAGLRHRRQRQRPAPAPAGCRRWRSAMPPRTSARRRVVVVSTAIQPDNPELVAARAKRLPVVRRADMLAELMRLKRSIAVAGTHGKTTTTAMMAALLDAAELDPTVVNGGIINAYGTNARLGQGDWIVVEADESDGSFLRLPATVAVVTNIDPEHMEHYGSFDALRDAFHAFVERVPFYGFAALVHRPSRGPGPLRPRHRPAPRHLRLQPAGRRPRPAADGRSRRRAVRRGHAAQERRGRAAARAPAAVAAGPPQRPERAGGDRRGARARHPGRGGPPHALRPGGRQAPLHPDRHGRRRRHRRRLRPPSGRDQGGADDRPRQDHGPRDRRRAAAPLHPPRQPVRRVLHLLPRRRHRAGGAGLRRRRAADRGRQPRRPGRGRASPRPPRRARHRRAGRSGAADRRATRGRAISSSAWVPAASPNGPTRCRAGWRRWRRGRARHERLARDACPSSAARCAATCRWRR